jgi:hypothetical protein
MSISGAADDPKKLPAGKELESALRMVDLKEFLPMLDLMRNNPDNANKFITKVAMTDPLFFKKIFHLVQFGDYEADLDAFIRYNEVVKAIKMLRERLNLGLKEAKQMYDARKLELGL